jgi:hypothetical protein
VIALARLPVARLLRTPRAWLGLGAWIAFALGFAVWLRLDHGTGAATRVLVGFFAPLVLPLVALGVVSAITANAGMGRVTRPLVALGASSGRAALAATFVGAAASAFLGTLLGVALVAIAHGDGDPALGRDLLTTAWVSALGGATYGAYFSFGACVGPRGAGRGMLLVFSWLLAEGSGVGTLLSVHAHVRSLLGGVAAGDLSQRGSAIALAILAGVSTLLATWRGARAR